MGGRGGSSGINAEPKGRSMSMKRFLENLAKNDRSGMLDALEKVPLSVQQAVFMPNGNAVKYQTAEFEVGENKVSVRFSNGWNPAQVIKPDRAIKQAIEIVSYEKGNANAIRVLAEKKSSSLKNAEKNYYDMLEQWKKLTKQKAISFK